MGAPPPVPGSPARPFRPPLRRRRPWPASLSGDQHGQIPLPSTDSLTVMVDRQRDDTVVRVVGELDAVGAPLVTALLDHVLQSGRVPTVLVDMGEVTFLDTHGLAPLMRPEVRIREASPAVQRVLRLLGLPVPETSRGPVLRHG